MAPFTQANSTSLKSPGNIKVLNRVHKHLNKQTIHKQTKNQSKRLHITTHLYGPYSS